MIWFLCVCLGRKMFPFVTCDLVPSQPGKRSSFELSFFISLLYYYQCYSQLKIFFSLTYRNAKEEEEVQVIDSRHHTHPLSSFSLSYICACSTQILLYKKNYGLLLHASEICTYIKQESEKHLVKICARQGLEVVLEGYVQINFIYIICKKFDLMTFFFFFLHMTG